MEKDFDYTSVPKTDLHCLNVQCPQAAGYLRHQISLHVTPETVIISALNPTHLAGKEKEYPYFRPDRLSRFALGITHLLDKMPHAYALCMKQEIYNYFKRNTYYRIYNKERLIHPREQEFIRQLFLRNGIKEDPAFNEYVDKYDWED